MRTELRKKRIERGWRWIDAAVQTGVSTYEYKAFEDSEGIPLPGFVDKLKQVFELTEEELNVKDGKRYDPNDKTPKKIVYKGIEFRSFLEAKWAFLFDLAGVKWEYEPDKEFTMSNGKKYWVDFLLHNVGIDHSEKKGEYFDLYVEAKGLTADGALPPDALYKANEFFKTSRFLINIGSVPPSIGEIQCRNHNYCEYSSENEKTTFYFWSFRYIDGTDRHAVIVFKDGQVLVRDAWDLDDIDINETNGLYKQAWLLDFSLGPVEVTPPVSKDRQLWEWLEKKRREDIERIKSEIREFEEMEDGVAALPASFRYKR